MRFFTGAAAVVALAPLAVVVAPRATAEPCGVNLGAEAVQVALNVQPDAFAGVPWARDPSTYEGNFNPCATLSVAIVTVEGATGSSPSVAMLFNHDLYAGTATPTPRGFTSLNAAQTSDNTVALNYRTPGTCNACGDGTVDTVRFQWQERPDNIGHVVQLDPLPSA
jgi:hypothetical protein